jgi:hypothetical protein
MKRRDTPWREVDSPYINAPVWPWSVAGWAFAALFVLLFVIAWNGS